MMPKMTTMKTIVVGGRDKRTRIELQQSSVDTHIAFADSESEPRARFVVMEFVISAADGFLQYCRGRPVWHLSLDHQDRFAESKCPSCERQQQDVQVSIFVVIARALARVCLLARYVSNRHFQCSLPFSCSSCSALLATVFCGTLFEALLLSIET